MGVVMAEHSKTAALIEKAQAKVRSALLAMEADPASIEMGKTYVRDYGNIAIASGEGTLPDGSRFCVERVEEFSGDGSYS
jgi:hypothetical protein